MLTNGNVIVAPIDEGTVRTGSQVAERGLPPETIAASRSRWQAGCLGHRVQCVTRMVLLVALQAQQWLGSKVLFVGAAVQVVAMGVVHGMALFCSRGMLRLMETHIRY